MYLGTFNPLKNSEWDLQKPNVFELEEGPIGRLIPSTVNGRFGEGSGKWQEAFRSTSVRIMAQFDLGAISIFILGPQEFHSFQGRRGLL